MMRTTLIALATLAAVTPVLAAATVLTPTEIKTVFGSGKPFTATSTSGQSFTFTFKVDGTASQVSKSGTTATIGKWRVSEKGYCTKWGTSGEHCYTVEKNGDRYDVRDSTGKAISRWTVLP